MRTVVVPECAFGNQEEKRENDQVLARQIEIKA
jgi:hypothetical protein